MSVLNLLCSPHFIYILPAVLLFTYQFALSNPSSTILIIDRACQDLNAKSCNEASVTGYTSKWMTYATLVNSILPAIAAGTWGILSDKYGRKLTFILSVIATIIQTMQMICFGVFKLPFWTLILFGSVSGILGGSAFCGFFSYVADVSENSSRRALFFSIIAAVQDIGILLGNATMGPIISNYGPIMPFYIIFGISCLLFLYVLIIPESLTDKNRVKKLKWYKVNIIASLKGIYTPSKLGPSYVKLLLSIIFTFSYSSFIGFVMILVLYSTQIFNWTPNELSFFAVVESGLRIFAALILAPLLFHKFTLKYISYSSIITISLILQTIAHIIYSLAPSTYYMYIGAIFEGLSAVSTPTIRVLFSRAHGPHEQGKILSAISAIETIINTTIPIIVLFIFSITNVDCPRCVLYIISSFSIIALILSILFWYISNTNWDSDSEIPPNIQINQESNEYQSVKEHPIEIGDKCPFVQLERDTHSKLYDPQIY